MFKKLAIALGVLVMVVLLFTGYVLWSIRPKETLDMSYDKIAISQKIMDMAVRRSLELRLTEEDLNNLMKRELSEMTLPSHVQIEGARLEQRGQMMTAHVQLRLYNLVRAEASLDFLMKWNSPNLQIEHVKTEVGRWNLPLSRYQVDPVVISLDKELPALVAIKDVVFEADQIMVSFKWR
ncbi:MAG: hypothetical protein K0R67_3690 [Paenibacillus sp.]|jgi:hypothetical protein|nr:hypothetical protein [Paenibacillus sp.]